ncbi:MAG: hypothetical protein GY899_14880 [Verrucomicrobiaceae bacterium]|nr:hypothetical protein [Verrucomicrobiaceae bacterium]
MPGNDTPQLAILIGDKIVHTIYFALGSAAFMLTLMQHPWRNYSMVVIFLSGMAMALVVGVFDEWHQTFTPNRHGNSPGDIMANLTGGIVGFYAALLGKKFIIQPHDLASQK